MSTIRPSARARGILTDRLPNAVVPDDGLRRGAVVLTVLPLVPVLLRSPVLLPSPARPR